ALVEIRSRGPFRPIPGGPVSEAVRTKRTAQVTDLAATRAYAERHPQSVAALLLYEGDAFRVVAMHGAPPEWDALRRRDPVIRFSPGNPLGRAVATKQLQHITDFRMEQSYIEREPGPVALAEAAGARTVLVVPMLKENELVGVIAIYRQEVRPFSK